MLEAELRESWKTDILDFLTWRTKMMFGDWTPQSVPELVRLLASRDWETILIGSVLASPNFHVDLAEMARLAPREMEQERRQLVRVAHGRLRGRVLALKTLVERTRRGDQTLWVTSNTNKIWQTEPNATVAGFLNYAFRASSIVVGHLEEGATALVTIGIQALERILRSEPLRRVDGDPAWSTRDLPPQLTAKSQFYRLADSWMRQVREARNTGDASQLRKTLMQGWLASEDDDRLLEVFALSRVVTLLYQSFEWDEFALNAGIRTTGSTSVIAKSGPVTIEVLFDRTPNIPGKYAWLLRLYIGIDGRGRRPDLQIITTTGHSERFVTFIEAKATIPNSQYGRDSVVKVLGYLKDFADLWDENAPRYPRCALLYASGIETDVDIQSRVEADEVLLSDTASFDADLDALVRRHLDLAGESP